MPRIPIYEQQTSVSTTTPSPQAQGMQIVSPVGNALNIAAGGFEELANAGLREQNLLTQKENADAIANTGKSLSDWDVKWKQYLTDGAQTTSDGGLVKQPDGTTVGFRGQTEKDYDTQSAKFLEGISNPKAKLYAQDHINQVRTRTLDGALTFEAQAGVLNRAQKVDDAVADWAKLAAADKSSPEVQLENVKQLKLAAMTMIANSGFDEQTRNLKAKVAVSQIVEAAVMGNIERNPGASKAALLARFGVDPTAPPGPQQGSGAAAGPDAGAVGQVADRLGISATDLATIISYETGGKFSPSIRGGKDNNHIGLIQFGNDEQRAYGANQGQSFSDQMQAVEKYLKARGVRPGDDLSTLYKIVNGGSRDVSGSASDGNGTIDEHVARMRSEHTGGAQKFLGGTSVTSGMTGGATPTPQPATYSPALGDLVDQLPQERVHAFLTQATTQVNQQQALVRTQLATTEGDQVTAYMNGQTVTKPLTATDYSAAYGPVEGASRFANYQSIQQLGTDMTSMKAMPPDQMANLVERYRPNPDAPGYELATKRYDTILKAADQVNQARQADPIAYAMQAGIGGAQPLNFQDAKAFNAELAKRQGVAATMQSTYGAPYSLLTATEAKTLHQGFDTMTTQQRLGYLQSIKGALADPAAYRSIMSQIAPDSPVTAMAGIILSKQSPMIQHNTFSADDVYRQSDVAGLLLEGEQLINPSKSAKGDDGKGKVFPMPKEQELRDEFTNKVGKAFAGDPRGADFGYQAVKAYYAGKSARIGDVSGVTDTRRLDEAITAVLGGVSDGGTGNNKVIKPWGMDDSGFKDAVQRSFDTAMQANGYAGSNAAALRSYGLQSVGDSKYLLLSGTSALVGRDNLPIVLDLTKISASAPAAPIDITPPSRVVQPKNFKPVTQQPKTK